MQFLQGTISGDSKSGCKSETVPSERQHERWHSLWYRFCELMDEEPLTFLQNCSKEDIMTVLKWLHDIYRRADLQLRSVEANLLASTTKECRQQVADTIDRQVNEQLNLSLLDLEWKEWWPERVEHEVAERKHVVDMLATGPPV